MNDTSLACPEIDDRKLKAILVSEIMIHYSREGRGNKYIRKISTVLRKMNAPDRMLLKLKYADTEEAQLETAKRLADKVLDSEEKKDFFKRHLQDLAHFAGITY